MTKPKPAARPRTKKGYHHEDLRRALLDAAIAFLAGGDVTGLTMQVLARAAGVSPGAPYHHFEDKVALLAALATEGFELWQARAEAAVASASTPPQRLAALGRAWLQFTREHPSHHRVMFLRDIEDRIRFAALHETSGRSLQLLTQAIAALDPSAPPERLAARAVVAWSSLHGFASLRASGVLTNIPGLPSLEALERHAVESLLVAARA
jgi:AcrR family transcriptional regulator